MAEDPADCSSSIRYGDGPEYACMLPDGHKGPHYAKAGQVGMTWTATYAPAGERKPPAGHGGAR